MLCLKTSPKGTIFATSPHPLFGPRGYPVWESSLRSHLQGKGIIDALRPDYLNEEYAVDSEDVPEEDSENDTASEREEKSLIRRRWIKEQKKDLLQRRTNDAKAREIIVAHISTNVLNSIQDVLAVADAYELFHKIQNAYGPGNPANAEVYRAEFKALIYEATDTPMSSI